MPAVIATAITVLLHGGALWCVLAATGEPPVMPLEMEDAVRVSLVLAPPAAPSEPVEQVIAPKRNTTEAASSAQATVPPARRRTTAEQGELQAAHEPSDVHMTVTSAVQPAQPVLAHAAAPAASIASAPASAALPPAPLQSSRSDDSWLAKLMSHLERYRRYPQAARVRRQQAVVYLRVQIDRNGAVQLLELQHPSGIPALDQAALDTLRRAQPLPQIPDDLPAPQDLLIPVEFLLQRH